MQGLLYQDKLKPIAELDAAGQVVSRFVYGVHPNVPDYLIKSGVSYRIVYDHLRSVRLVVDWITGAVVQRMEYDEFGRVLVNTNPGFQPFGYAGGMTDSHTGLVRFGARDYEPSIGRWTAKDPIGFEGRETNMYGYVGADPLNWIDPLGQARGCPVDFSNCWMDCMNNYPGVKWAIAGLGIGFFANMKKPSEWRPGYSRFTSVDRRLPSWMKPKLDSGIRASRGTAGRLKPVGRYGTAAAILGAFSGGYLLGASGVCLHECATR